MKKIVIFTGNELRHLSIHDYFLKSKVKLLKTFSEKSDQDIKKRLGSNLKNNTILKRQFELRKKNEKKFFKKIKKKIEKNKIY